MPHKRASPYRSCPNEKVKIFEVVQNCVKVIWFYKIDFSRQIKYLLSVYRDIAPLSRLLEYDFKLPNKRMVIQIQQSHRLFNTRHSHTVLLYEDNAECCETLSQYMLTVREH